MNAGIDDIFSGSETKIKVLAKSRCICKKCGTEMLRIGRKPLDRKVHLYSLGIVKTKRMLCQRCLREKVKFY